MPGQGRIEMGLMLSVNDKSFQLLRHFYGCWGVAGAFHVLECPWAKEGHPELRQAGVLLALHCTPAQERIACRILRENGGKDVERANGRWAYGELINFDLLVPPQREPEPTPRDKASMPSGKTIRGT
jgi:hypothetical protein